MGSPLQRTGGAGRADGSRCWQTHTERCGERHLPAPGPGGRGRADDRHSPRAAAVSDPTACKNGRQLAAWLGLVPRQHSSGGKPGWLGISKRGDRSVRSLLIHGARAIVSGAATKTDPRSRWIAEKPRLRGTNRACVAVANKHARILWAFMAKPDTDRRVAEEEHTHSSAAAPRRSHRRLQGLIQRDGTTGGPALF